MDRGRLKIELLYHDLKGPLAIIKTGLTSLLNKRDKYGTLTAKQEKLLQRVLRNTKIAQNLVDDILELGRSEAGVINIRRIKLSFFISEVLFEIFDLTEGSLLNELSFNKPLQNLQETLRNDGFYLSINQNLWNKEFSLDEKKLKQILRNLLLNALRYKNTRVSLEVAETDGGLFFSVMDDGKGIPPQYHKKIFERYFQLDETENGEVRGYGLGLAGVLMLVEDMGGKLSLESDVGRGAKFTVYIPIAENLNGLLNR